MTSRFNDFMPRLVSILAFLFLSSIVVGLVQANAAEPRPTLPTVHVLPIDTVRVKDNRGGIVAEFEKLVQKYNAMGAKVQIEGKCYSACTLFTAAKEVCVLPGAELWFHAPFIPRDDEFSIREYDSIYTQIFIAKYPQPIRDWVEAHGGLTPDWIVLKGKELAKLVPTCEVKATV